jgi:two-component SAPR family response regulator
MLASLPAVEVVGQFHTPGDALEQVKSLHPDAVFLDVEMPGMNGLELAIKLMDCQEDLQVVFVTAYDDYAVQAFEVNAMDYILKPFDLARLTRAVARLQTASRQLAAANQPPASQPLASRLTASAVSIQMFGGFSVMNSQGQVIRWTTSKTEELLACLLLNHRAVAKWPLMDTLWPDADPRRAEQNLYTTIYRLKKTLREQQVNLAISVDKGTYRLILPETLAWDVQILRQASKATDRPTMAEALAIYHAELLAGRDYRWCYPFRQEMRSLYRHIFVKLVYEYLLAGEDQEALALMKTCAGHLQMDANFQAHVRTLIKSIPNPQIAARLRMLLQQLASETY